LKRSRTIHVDDRARAGLGRFRRGHGAIGLEADEVIERNRRA